MIFALALLWLSGVCFGFAIACYLIMDSDERHQPPWDRKDVEEAP